MSIQSVLINPENGRAYLVGRSPTSPAPVLITRTPQHEFGVFASTSQTTAGTYILVTPLNTEAIVLTDIMISAKKKAGSSLTLQFDDDTDAVTIFSPDTVQAEVNFGIALSGKFASWAGARLEVVTVADVVFTASIGYHKLNTEESFTTWDARR